MKLNNYYSIVLIAILLLASKYSTAQKYKFEQKFNSKDLTYLKSAKFYIGTTGNLAYDTVLIRIAKSNWTFNEIQDTLNIKELNDRISKKENIAYIAIARVGSSNLDSHKSATYALQLNTNGGKYGIYHQHLCYSKGFKESLEKSLFTGVNILNSKLTIMDKEQLQSSSDLKEYATKRKNLFKEKTLYIPTEWLNGVTETDFKAGYTNSVKFVSLEDYFSIIEEGREDAIYVLPIAAPAEGGFVNTHIFIEADGHNYLGLCQRLTMAEMSSNVFNGYDGDLEERHIKLYSNVANGKW